MNGGKMNQRSLSVFLVTLLILVATSAVAQQKTILFDAAHAQTAGNADWTLDEDSCGIAQRFPTPDQSGITPATAETYWNGAHSAMGDDLEERLPRRVASGRRAHQLRRRNERPGPQPL